MPAVASTIVPPGFRSPRCLGFLDHRQADAVLDRAAGIHVFELQEQLARAGVEALQLQHRRAADHLQRILVNVHADSRRSAPAAVPDTQNDMR